MRRQAANLKRLLYAQGKGKHKVSIAKQTKTKEDRSEISLFHDEPYLHG